MTYSPPKLICHSYYLLFGLLGSGIIPALTKRFEDTFALEHSQMGALLGSVAFAFALASIASGYLVDRYGPSRVLAIAMLGCAGAGALMWWAPTAGWFVAALLAFQGANGLSQSINGTVSALYGPRRSAGLNLLHGFQGIGRLLAPLAVLAAIGATGSWRLAFAVSAVVHLAWAGLFHHGLRGVVPTTLNGARFDLRGVGRVLSFRPIWIALAGFVALMGAEMAAITWVPDYLEREGGFSRDSALLALTCMMVGFTAARLLLGVRGRGVPLSLILAGAVAMVACYAGLVFLSAPWAIFAVTFVMGLAVGGWWPSLAAKLMDAVPEGHGVIGGLCNIACACGLLLFLTGIGRLGDAVGLRWALMVTPVSALAFAALYITFARTVDRRSALPAPLAAEPAPAEPAPVDP